MGAKAHFDLRPTIQKDLVLPVFQPKRFDVVAIAPAGESPLRVTIVPNKNGYHSGKILRSMSEMDLPLEPVGLSAMTNKMKMLMKTTYR